MDEVSRSGRTVLFVSHNLPSVRQLCSKAILLTKGKLAFSGSSQETITRYLASNEAAGITNRFEKRQLEDKDVQLVKAELFNREGNPCDEFDISEDIFVDLTIHCFKQVPDIYGYITIMNNHEEILIQTDTLDHPPNSLENLVEGENKFRLNISSYILPFGEYTLYLAFAKSFGEGILIDVPGNILKFSIADHKTVRRHRRIAKTSHLIKWEIQQ